MKTARTVGLGTGLLLMLGVGTVSLSVAQQTGVSSKAGATARSEPRERLIKLRGEIDLLQVEYDVARSDYTKSLELLSSMQLEMYNEFCGAVAEMGTLKPDDRDRVVKGIRASDSFKGLNDGDRAKLTKAAAGLLSGEKDAVRGLFQTLRDVATENAALIDARKRRFGDLSNALIRKKLDLEEAERVYQTEAR